VSVAWDNFIASVDVAQLERERMRVLGSLTTERPGSRQEHEVMHGHNKRRLEFRRQLSLAPVPFWFTAKQLQIAEDALRGPVGGFGGRVASPAHENTSTEVKPSDRLTGSNVDSRKTCNPELFNEWITTSTKREEAA
jgi:hypothetical protein